MTVYIDDARIPATVANGRARHASRWSHLFAGTEAELHEFAARLGLRRSYFQPGRPRGDGQPSPFWHYDLTEGKRGQAVRLGACEVPWRHSPAIMRANEADRVAARAWRAGHLEEAGRMIGVARELDPARSGLWDERAARIGAVRTHQASRSGGSADLSRPCGGCEHQAGAHVGGATPEGWAIYDRTWAAASGFCTAPGCECTRRTQPTAEQEQAAAARYAAARREREAAVRAQPGQLPDQKALTAIATWNAAAFARSRQPESGDPEAGS